MELQLRFISVGHRNIICASKITAIMSLRSKFSKRYLAEAKRTNRFFNLTSGHKARSLIIMDNGLVVTSAVNAHTLYKRFNAPITDVKGDDYKQDNFPDYTFVSDMDEFDKDDEEGTKYNSFDEEDEDGADEEDEPEEDEEEEGEEDEPR